jgi:hypothetical protein
MGVSPGIEPGGIVFPSRNINIFIYLFGILQAMWKLDIFSSAAESALMTHCECHVDRPFSVMWLGDV